MVLSFEMEFVREVRRDTSPAMQLCKSFSTPPRLFLFCKFFQGIDKIFFISAARLKASGLKQELLCWNISLCFAFIYQNYSEVFIELRRVDCLLLWEI